MNGIATLKKNIINAHGSRGENWINSLETTIQVLQNHWLLTDIHPVNNMSWNYVALSKQKNHPVVLKISCDAKAIQAEYNALQRFAGRGAIKVIDYNTDCHALLLDQAVPGDLLKAYPSNQMEAVILIYADVVKKLNTPVPIHTSFEHVREWCKVIDNINDPRIPEKFIIKAKMLRTTLLSSTGHEYLCHGDLHLENIIRHHSHWLSIDPKGIIGELAFEAAAFDLISDEDLNDSSRLISKVHDRIHRLSHALALDKNRLIGWIFLRIMLSIQWSIEDKGDPTRMLENAHCIFPLCASCR